jgi:hypothetical protein
MDDLERDKFYTEPPAADEDEYELEEPDPAVDEARKQAILQSIERRIDLDEVYRESERNRGSEILEGWLRNLSSFRWQFRIKHLLILTAVVAIALTLVRLHLFWPALIVGIMLSVAGLYFYLNLQDRKQQAEADRKREELYAKRRAQFGPAATGHVVGGPVTEPSSAVEQFPQLPNETDRIWQEAAEREAFRFQFSLRELILVMTIAAVVLGMMQWLGGPAGMATVLGLAALVGLFVFAMGYEPPQVVVFVWWIMLVFYILVSFFAAVWGGFG